LPDGWPAGDIYWPAFGPRTIQRASHIEGKQGFMPGASILAAQATWEGADVFDPWVVVLEDGTARLYYAAAGGIGLAVASSIDGTFERVSDAPLLSGTMRRPSVV